METGDLWQGQDVCCAVMWKGGYPKDVSCGPVSSGSKTCLRRGLTALIGSNQNVLICCQNETCGGGKVPPHSEAGWVSTPLAVVVWWCNALGLNMGWKESDLRPYNFRSFSFSFSPAALNTPKSANASPHCAGCKWRLVLSQGTFNTVDKMVWKQDMYSESR